MLQVVIFAVIVGVALVALTPKQSKPLLDLMTSLQHVCMTVVRWAMRLAPFAVFGLMARLTSQLGVEALLGVAYYVATTLIGLTDVAAAVPGAAAGARAPAGRRVPACHARAAAAGLLHFELSRRDAAVDQDRRGSSSV